MNTRFAHYSSKLKSKITKDWKRNISFPVNSSIFTNVYKRLSVDSDNFNSLVFAVDEYQVGKRSKKDQILFYQLKYWSDPTFSNLTYKVIYAILYWGLKFGMQEENFHNKI